MAVNDDRIEIYLQGEEGERFAAMVQNIVYTTIECLRRDGLLEPPRDKVYRKTASKIKEYFLNGEKDKKMSCALLSISGDRYIDIIYLYYQKGYTVERIAEMLDVDVSTITRNKRRLCIEIYENLKGEL